MGSLVDGQAVLEVATFSHCRYKYEFLSAQVTSNYYPPALRLAYVQWNRWKITVRHRALTFLSGPDQRSTTTPAEALGYRLLGCGRLLSLERFLKS